ncbi:TATA-box-binding protein [Halorussus pelagicus]|uniref:TATA-box-binding protein n=1 Tax=Halorussus pelagicus TaxID=2505977 RepID=UPI000FFB6AB4|nr:transcription factor [Halorussus pelagicus]
MEIVSTMGSGSLGREIDLETLVSELENHLGEIVDANFHGPSMVTVRLKENGPAYTIYRTGTFQIRGAGTELLLTEAFRQFEEVLDDIGVDTTETEFKQVTSVFMEDLGREINLEAFAIALGLEYIEYEPEQFPGLIYRPTQYDVTLLVFASGKVIIGGTTDNKHAKSATQHLRDQLSIFDDC